MTWNLQLIIGPGGLTFDPPPLPLAYLSANVFNGELHVCYVSATPAINLPRASCSIWDVWCNGATGQWSLLQLTGPGGLASGSPLAWGFVTPATVTYNNQMHVCYSDDFGLIWDAWYNGATGQWKLQQLAGPGGLSGGPPIGNVDPFAVTYNDQMHVCYSDINGVIWDAWYDGVRGVWNAQQLTGSGGLTNGPTCNSLLSVVVYSNHMHVCYGDLNALVWDAWYDGATGQWNPQQLAGPGGLAGGPAAGSHNYTNTPAAVTYGDQMHVCYCDINGVIWDAWYDGARGVWNSQQLTGTGGRTNGPPCPGFTVSVVVYGDQMHVCYCDQNGVIWDAWYDGVRGVWSLQQLVGPVGLAGSLTALWLEPVAVTYNNQMHVFYLGATGSTDEGSPLWDAWYNPTGP